MEWWMWVIGGLALLALEMLIPGLIVFLFFGCAAILIGVLEGLGLAGPIWMQWVLFSVLSILSLLVLRGPILRRLSHRGDSEGRIDSLVGREVVLLTDLTPGEPGKAELRGTSWGVVSTHGAPLSKGTRCIVEAVEGLTLHVRDAAPTASAEPAQGDSA